MDLASTIGGCLGKRFAVGDKALNDQQNKIVASPPQPPRPPGLALTECLEDKVCGSYQSLRSVFDAHLSPEPECPESRRCCQRPRTGTAGLLVLI
ncbi:Phospholipase A1 [Psidium guajava]|nr:Phospholipase A1 [Psidium guajava]